MAPDASSACWRNIGPCSGTCRISGFSIFGLRISTVTALTGGDRGDGCAEPATRAICCTPIPGAVSVAQPTCSVTQAALAASSARNERLIEVMVEFLSSRAER